MAPDTTAAPMNVRFTLIPACSAAGAFSPTALILNPQILFDNNKCTKPAEINAIIKPA